MTFVHVFRCGAQRTVGCGAVITVRSPSVSYFVNGIDCPVCGRKRVATKVGEG